MEVRHVIDVLECVVSITHSGKNLKTTFIEVVTLR